MTFLQHAAGLHLAMVFTYWAGLKEPLWMLWLATTAILTVSICKLMPSFDEDLQYLVKMFWSTKLVAIVPQTLYDNKLLAWKFIQSTYSSLRQEVLLENLGGGGQYASCNWVGEGAPITRREQNQPCQKALLIEGKEACEWWKNKEFPISFGMLLAHDISWYPHKWSA